MGTYQYAIIKTKKVKGLSETIGDIGVFDFRYKYSWSWDDKYDKQCARLDANINRKWEGKQLPLVVTDGHQMYIWVGDSANWCDSDEKNGAKPIGSLAGMVAIIQWERDNEAIFPEWLWRAGEDEDNGLIPFVPATEAEYWLLSDAHITKRLRERGDTNAQPMSPNNPYWAVILANLNSQPATA